MPEVTAWQNRPLECGRFEGVRGGHWDILSTFFAYPTEIRKIIYTTNIIEGLNRQFRKSPRTSPACECDFEAETDVVLVRFHVWQY